MKCQFLETLGSHNCTEQAGRCRRSDQSVGCDVRRRQAWVSPRLVGVDEKLLARGALGVDGEICEIERLLQRNHPCVVAGEGGLELGNDTLPELLPLGRTNLHQEWEQQPAALTPIYPD